MDGASSLAFHSTAPTSTVRLFEGLPPGALPPPRSSTAEPSALASNEASQEVETTTPVSELSVAALTRVVGAEPPAVVPAALGPRRPARAANTP